MALNPKPETRNPKPETRNPKPILAKPRKALYEAIDEDSSGMITREMLEASFQNESPPAFGGL